MFANVLNAPLYTGIKETVLNIEMYYTKEDQPSIILEILPFTAK